MKEQLTQLVDWVPFIGLAIGNPEHQPVITRLIEAAIIGVVVMYGTVQATGARIDGLEQRVQEVKAELGTIRRDIYRPITRPGAHP